jgi:hypothetical protein
MNFEDRPSVWQRLKPERPNVIGSIENGMADFGVAGIMMLARAVAVLERLPDYVTQTYKGEDVAGFMEDYLAGLNNLSSDRTNPNTRNFLDRAEQNFKSLRQNSL